MEIVPATPAPELREITGWANSPPLSVKGLKGSVILLDCWTYTCSFCLRTLPVLRRLHEKYAMHGLRVIEAHSYEYEFAKDPANIARALARYNVNEVPVAYDTSNKTWDAYGNTYWPKHVLIDGNGLVRYEHAGYGTIVDFEDAVVELLREAGQSIEAELDKDDPKDEIYETYGIQFAGMAPEICVGYSRLRRFGNNQKLKPDAANYVSDSPSHEMNVVYLRGKWVWERERVSIADRATKDSRPPAVMMHYNSARRVHAILGTTDGRPGKAEIRVDGKPLSKDNLGRDCVIEGERSVVNIDWPFMYNVAKTPEPEVHEVEVSPLSDNFAFYTFVFG